MVAADDGAPSVGGKNSHTWLRMAAYLCLGIAIGEPGAQSLVVLHNLSGHKDLDEVRLLPFFIIGTVAIARLAWAPIIDAFNPPVLKKLGRRRGWAALLITMQLAVTIPIVGAAWIGSPAGPNFPGLMILAVAIAGGLLAITDGLRSTEPDARFHGAYAAAQYIGAVVPFLVLSVFVQRQENLAINITLCFLLFAGWLGLWLFPDAEAQSKSLTELRRVKQLIDTGHGLSAGGRIVIGWAYGVLLCPITDFFRRYGRTTWIILAILVVGDIATGLRPVTIIAFYANTSIIESLESIISIIKVAPLFGGVLAAYLIWRFGSVTGLAYAFVAFGLSLALGIIAAVTAPLHTPYLMAVCAHDFADGATFVAFTAFVSRLVAPQFAAFQFSLLWIAGPTLRQFEQLKYVGINSLGYIGTYVFFLALLSGVVALTWWLAGHLDGAPRGEIQS